MLGSRIAAAEGLPHPRLCENVDGRSNASLRDFEDYSRPIGEVSIVSILPRFFLVRFECCD
jgi:hypothetical protein